MLPLKVQNGLESNLAISWRIKHTLCIRLSQCFSDLMERIKHYDIEKFVCESLICYIPSDKSSNIHQLVNRLINYGTPIQWMLLNSVKKRHGWISK